MRNMSYTQNAQQTHTREHAKFTCWLYVLLALHFVWTLCCVKLYWFACSYCFSLWPQGKYIDTRPRQMRNMSYTQNTQQTRTRARQIHMLAVCSARNAFCVDSLVCAKTDWLSCSYCFSLWPQACWYETTPNAQHVIYTKRTTNTNESTPNSHVGCMFCSLLTLHFPVAVRLAFR